MKALIGFPRTFGGSQCARPTLRLFLTEIFRHTSGLRLDARLAYASTLARLLSLPRDLSPYPLHRVVVAIDDALFEGDDGVVGDLDVLGADFGAALGDVAVAQAELLFDERQAVFAVDGVHLQAGHADEEA